MPNCEPLTFRICIDGSGRGANQSDTILHQRLIDDLSNNIVPLHKEKHVNELLCSFCEEGNTVLIVDGKKEIPYTSADNTRRSLAVKRFTRQCVDRLRRLRKHPTPTTPKKKPYAAPGVISSPIRGICSLCGEERRNPSPHVIERQRKDIQTPTGQVYAKEYHNLCINCFTSGVIAKREKMADDSVKGIINLMRCRQPIGWPVGKDKVEVICLITHSPRLYGILSNHFVDSLFFQQLAHEPLLVRMIEYNEEHVDQEVLLDAIGGQLPSDCTIPRHRLLRAPPDGSFGYISMPSCRSVERISKGQSPNNHVVLHDINIPIEEVADFMKEETRMIEMGAMIKRPGPAGGYPLPATTGYKDPMALSVGTREGRTTMMQESTRSTGYRLSYWSKKQKKMITCTIYSDMKGRKVEASSNNTKDSKYRMASESESYRSILIRVMQDRIKYLAILEHFGHHPTSAFEQLEEWLSSFDEIDAGQAHFATEVEDDWFRFLLLYDIFNLTSHINHEACKVHADGNGNETITLFGRWKGSIQGNSLENVENAHSGEIALLNHALGIALSPGRTVAHATLDETFHVPDSSRNNLNFTVSEHPRKPRN